MSAGNTKTFIIPARPEVLLKLATIIKQPDPDFGEIAALLKSDVSLYSNVLATINTPFFGFPERISSIQNAVALLGVNRLYTIVRMAALRNTLGETGRLDRFWDSANEVATICGQVSRHLRFLSKDDAYTMGMMHDCGVPLMMKNFNDYKNFFESRSGTDLPQIHTQERDRYQLDHFDISSKLAAAWGIPEVVCEAIRLQPYSSEVLDSNGYSEEVQNVLCMLLIAKELSEKFRQLWSVDDSQRPVVPMEPILEHLGLVDIDLIDMKDDIFSRLELDDNGIVPK